MILFLEQTKKKIVSDKMEQIEYKNYYYKLLFFLHTNMLKNVFENISQSYIVWQFFFLKWRVIISTNLEELLKSQMVPISL